MDTIIKLANYLQNLLNHTRKLDFLGSLALRLYLAPVFWIAGSNKLSGFDNVVEWFGNPDWGLGLPVPWLMAALATGTELIGAVLLVTGFAVRWISIPLMFTMIVAAVSVHWENGWQAIADMKSPFPTEDIDQVMEKLAMAREILQEYGNYDWLTSSGNFVISNNGVEWAVTYFIMLLVLFFIGAGKYTSIDFWIKKHFSKEKLPIQNSKIESTQRTEYSKRRITCAAHLDRIVLLEEFIFQVVKRMFVLILK